MCLWCRFCTHSCLCMAFNGLCAMHGCVNGALIVKQARFTLFLAMLLLTKCVWPAMRKGTTWDFFPIQYKTHGDGQFFFLSESESPSNSLHLQVKQGYKSILGWMYMWIYYTNEHSFRQEIKNSNGRLWCLFTDITWARNKLSWWIFHHSDLHS